MALPDPRGEPVWEGELLPLRVRSGEPVPVREGALGVSVVKALREAVREGQGEGDPLPPLSIAEVGEESGDGDVGGESEGNELVEEVMLGQEDTVGLAEGQLEVLGVAESKEDNDELGVLGRDAVGERDTEGEPVSGAEREALFEALGVLVGSLEPLGEAEGLGLLDGLPLTLALLVDEIETLDDLERFGEAVAQAEEVAAAEEVALPPHGAFAPVEETVKEAGPERELDGETVDEPCPT